MQRGWCQCKECMSTEALTFAQGVYFKQGVPIMHSCFSPCHSSQKVMVTGQNLCGLALTLCLSVSARSLFPAVHDNHASSAWGLIPADPCAGAGAGAGVLASPRSRGPLSRRNGPRLPLLPPAPSPALRSERGRRELGVRLRSARSLQAQAAGARRPPWGGRASGQGPPSPCTALVLLRSGAPADLRGVGVHGLSQSCLTCRARR